MQPHEGPPEKPKPKLDRTTMVLVFFIWVLLGIIASNLLNRLL
jgi:hypothetical protein